MQNCGLDSSPPFSTGLWKNVLRDCLALKANPWNHSILPCLLRTQRQKEARGEFWRWFWGRGCEVLCRCHSCVVTAELLAVLEAFHAGPRVLNQMEEIGAGRFMCSSAHMSCLVLVSVFLLCTSHTSSGVQSTHDVCNSGMNCLKFLYLFPETLKEIKILHSWKLRFMST